MNGWGNYSPVTWVQAARIPDAPTPVQVVTSDSTSITLQMGTCEENGGSPLLTYTLYRDNGSLQSAFTDIYSGLFQGQHQVTGLTPGLKYHFKITATNAIGESDFSAETSWYSAALPSKPSALTRGALSSRT